MMEREGKKIFLICAEKSGNNIIHQVLNRIDKEILKNTELYGVVDDEIAMKYNIKQIFSPEKLAVLGIGDIITKIPSLLDKISYTASKILNIKPDIVISVDAYDFCIRVAKIVKKSNNKIKLWHIVAPSVWAYWSGRSKTLSKYYNHLFYFLPFEKPYFKKYEHLGENEFLTTFIGYPATFSNNINKEEDGYNIERDKNLIGITIGSRVSEINRHISIISKTIMLLKIANKDYQFAILATKDTAEYIRNYFKKYRNIVIIDDDNEKKETIKKCVLIIAKSGTNNIEIGSIGTPMITYYKTSPLTYFFAKLFSKTKLINLFNITLGKMAIPELVQKKLTPENLAKTAFYLINNDEERKKQVDNIKIAINQMQREDKKYPLDIVADNIKQFIIGDCLNKNNDIEFDNNKKNDFKTTIVKKNNVIQKDDRK